MSNLNEVWNKAKELVTGFLPVKFKKPTKATLEQYPTVKGVQVSVNLEGQSKLIRDICMLDDVLLASGRYGIRDILDAKNCIEDDGLRVKLCKYLDKYMEVMTGKTGYKAMEIVNRNKGDETKLAEAAANWKYDSTPVKRVVNRDTRPIDERLADIDDHDGKIELVIKEMKISKEKAEVILPILEG